MFEFLFFGSAFLGAFTLIFAVDALIDRKWGRLSALLFIFFMWAYLGLVALAEEKIQEVVSHDPCLYKIDEENGIGYFYWKDVAVKTQDYKLLKSPQDVVVEEVRSFKGFGVITNSLPVVYRAALQRVEK